MKRYTLIGLIVGTLVVLVLLFSYLSSPGERDPIQAPLWVQSYESDDESPYGAYVLFNLLKEESSIMHIVEESVLTDLPEYHFENDKVYFFIGEEQFLNYDEANAIANFVYSGNIAFLVVEEPAHDLMYYFTSVEGWDSYIDSSVELSFANRQYHPPYELKYLQNFETKHKQWTYAPESDLQLVDSLEILGRDDLGGVTFFRFPLGEGEIYFHTVPMALSNISMLDSAGLEYAEAVLSYLPKDPNVYWDELTKYPHSYEDISRKVNRPNESPLQFILDSPSLRWAYYLLWATIILYIFFRGKREQRVIPPIEKDENTTMNFINTVADLYFRQGKHEKLVVQKKKIFLDHLRDHYYLPVHKLDDLFFERLSMKSGLNEEKIREIFTMFDQLIGTRVSTEQLVELQQKLEWFHKNSQ